MEWIIGSLLIGLVIGFIIQQNHQIERITKILINVFLILLLFFMGYSIGMNKSLVEQLPSLGFESILISLGAIGGSVLLVFVFEKLEARKIE